MPLSSCYLKRPQRQGLVLGYGGVAAADMTDAVAKLRVATEAAASSARRIRADGRAARGRA
jgi:hypothetical protein